MEFDRARIAICERAWIDNLDLALHVIRRQPGAVLGYALVGILPFAWLNYWLLEHWFPSLFYEDLNWRLIWWTILLVMIEMPLATAPLTLFLGQSLFVERPRPGEIARALLASLPQMLLLQLFVRAILIFLVVTWIFPFAVWPFLNEVILLERNPLVARKGQLSTLRRNTILHDGNSGDFMARGLTTLFLAPLLAWALWVTQSFLLEALFGVLITTFSQAVTIQLVFWILVVFFTVARFLSYLDQRIRGEGWEVELLLRAERERMTRSIA